MATVHTELQQRLRNIKLSDGRDPELAPTKSWLKRQGILDAVIQAAENHDREPQEYLTESLGFQRPPEHQFNMPSEDERRAVIVWLNTIDTIGAVTKEDIGRHKQHIRQLNTASQRAVGESILAILDAPTSQQATLLEQLFHQLYLDGVDDHEHRQITATYEQWEAFLRWREIINTAKVKQAREFFYNQTQTYTGN